MVKEITERLDAVGGASDQEKAVAFVRRRDRSSRPTAWSEGWGVRKDSDEKRSNIEDDCMIRMKCSISMVRMTCGRKMKVRMPG